ncbi:MULTISPECIES: hypothetical protein [unclassified Burkholderia]|uniref:hypothetical protein n=1 Tax=unclassified Burkholderia TaxID=2613784 RepID=UPI00141FA524|nr:MULTISPECIES: hypothetical protein [unclassified Burkholderia]NIE82508.1 hypothetical protein [Burkholderia sp. Tr-860]NIF61285.1 hypothetical protein [Burkholderia sp. Cy-647]NIF94490.1 hypothetical protein [Burkholderia sp. Ax-1720]
MTHAISTFIALARQASKGSVEWGGYRWKITRTGLTTSLERVEIGTLSHIRIVETLSSQADEGPSYHATVRASDIARLVAYNGNLSSAQAGCSWTEAFQWGTRKIGGVTWRACSVNAESWYAVIEGSIAEIFRHEDYGHTRYIVTRSLILGRQAIELKLLDLASKDEPPSLVSFEQASDLAQTLPDFALDRMRMPSPASIEGRAQ